VPGAADSKRKHRPEMTSTPRRNAFAVPLRIAALMAALAAGFAACERVEPAATQGGTATLTWSPVTRDSHGDQLKNLAGYKVFYGTAPRALYSVIVVPDPHVTRYVVHDLAPGAWYFAVAAYTASNVEGARSNVVEKNVR
jgi:hypothetical protein